MRVSATVCSKGGVGKTTTTANLGGLLADAGLRVLLIDLDSQPTLSSYYELSQPAPGGVYELLATELVDLDQIISHTAIPNLDIIVSNDYRNQLQQLLLNAPNGRLWLSAQRGVRSFAGIAAPAESMSASASAHWASIDLPSGFPPPHQWNRSVRLRSRQSARMSKLSARFTEEQIIGILAEHEVEAKCADSCRKHGVSEGTFYNWKSRFGGMTVSEAKRLKALEDQNGKLKKLLAEQMLDLAAMKELLSKK